MAAPKKGTLYIGPILAVVFSFGMILVANILEGGSNMALFQPTAAMIVLGGTFGAAWLASTPDEVRGLRKAFWRLFFPPRVDRRLLLDTMTKVANVARRNGTLAVEEMLPSIEDPFLRRGLQALVDGWSPSEIEKLLELEMDMDEHHATNAAKLLESAGGYSPTIGILGAVLGLIHVMQNLTDPSKLGTGIAVAFVATIYGVGLANLLYLPLGARLKKLAKNDAELRSMMVTGLELVASGATPRKVEDMLSPWITGAGKPVAPPEPPGQDIA